MKNYYYISVSVMKKTECFFDTFFAYGSCIADEESISLTSL